MSHDYAPETLRDWADRCLYEARRPLSKWEQEFCESVMEQLDARKRLTDRQVEILERIYTEKTD